MGSGDSPGLQNRRLASPMSMVRSTRTRFRQFYVGAHPPQLGLRAEFEASRTIHLGSF